MATHSLFIRVGICLFQYGFNHLTISLGFYLVFYNSFHMSLRFRQKADFNL